MIDWESLGAAIGRQRESLNHNRPDVSASHFEAQIMGRGLLGVFGNEWEGGYVGFRIIGSE